MWETIKNDPVLKIVTIIILSVLGFGFAFNIMFGPNNTGMEHGSGMGSGYSLGNTLSYIFVLAFKLLLIALVVIALMSIFKFAKKHLFEGGEIKMFDSIKNDPVLKGITVVVLLVIAFGLIYYLFTGIFGFGSGYGMMNGYAMTGTAGYGFGLSGLLAVLLKVLLFASVVGLIVGLVMYIKQSYGSESGKKVKEECASCGVELNKEWKCCPVCGTEKASD